MRPISNMNGIYTSGSSRAVGTAPPPAQIGGGFQTSSLGGTTTLGGVSSVMSSPLGSQTMSTLLQIQDLDQTISHGGGGGHHSSIKLAPNVMEEVAGETAEAEMLQRRRKLAKLVNVNAIVETADGEESNELKDTATSEKSSAAEQKKNT